MADEEYLRRLDSLARFYNSQITAHVGWLVSVTFGVLAALLTFTSISLDKLSWPVVLAIDLVVVLVYVFYPAPFCFKYWLGRLEYWSSLSLIVFEHMGLKSKAAYFKMLKRRARRAKGGVEEAVISLLEARMFLGRCRLENLDMENEENVEVFDVRHRESGIIGTQVWYEDPFIVPSRRLGFAKGSLLFLAKNRQYTNDDRRALLELVFKHDC